MAFLINRLQNNARIQDISSEFTNDLKYRNPIGAKCSIYMVRSSDSLRVTEYEKNSESIVIIIYRKTAILRHSMGPKTVVFILQRSRDQVDKQMKERKQV